MIIAYQRYGVYSHDGVNQILHIIIGSFVVSGMVEIAKAIDNTIYSIIKDPKSD